MAKCDACGYSTGLFEGLSRAKDGKICKTCVKSCPAYKTTDIETIGKYSKVESERQSIFKKEVELFSANKTDPSKSKFLRIDDTNRLFALEYMAQMSGRTPISAIYSFDEVETYDLETTAGETITKSKGGLTRAAIGAVTFGGAGAIVGATTSKTKSVVKNQQKEITVYLQTYSGRRSETFVASPDVIAFFDKILDEAESELQIETTSEVSQFSVSDELIKLKSLLDAGVLTQEEFDQQKQKLLS